MKDDIYSDEGRFGLKRFQLFMQHNIAPRGGPIKEKNFPYWALHQLTRAIKVGFLQVDADRNVTWDHDRLDLLPVYLELHKDE